MAGDWDRWPPIELASPALAVLAGSDGVWAGGLGGVARYTAEAGWTPLPAGLAVTSVIALARGAGCLLAGGAGGIARSADDGRSWQQSALPGGASTVTAIALSPTFAHDGTALAGTLEHGVLRSTDAGRSWQASGFGLPSREILGLAWGAAEAVVAATPAGLARSPNAGRSWRVCAGAEGIGFAALAARADGTVLATSDAGPLLRSTGDLTTWTPVGCMPEDVGTWALTCAPDGGLLLGTADHGILRSTDDGSTWSPVSQERAFCFAAGETHLFAGTNAGVMVSADGGRAWTELPPAPLHDWRRLLVVEGMVLVTGASSPPVLRGRNGDWTPLEQMPLPLAGLWRSTDGQLFASTPDGLFRSGDAGVSWETVIEGEAGCVARMTFLPTGDAWAGVTPDGAIVRTRDGGRSWERFPAPFGVLPLVGLQALPGAASLMAATFDERQRAVGIWRSDDGGATWARGADSHTPWPLVATHGTPPAVTVGNVVTVQQPDGTWRQTRAGTTGIRRLVADDARMFALAGNGLWRSDDRGATWARDDAGLPVERVLDVALDSGVFFVLLTGGLVWSRAI